MLRKETTSDALFEILEKLMVVPELNSFRLVGGTALSLLIGHRISEDIDLFTVQDYGTIPFKEIEYTLRQTFPYVFNIDTENIPALLELENNYGLHLYVGSSEQDRVKVDILYWGNAAFLFPAAVIDNIRLATVPEIATMKLDAISRGGRKKDFWDMSEILEKYDLRDLLDLYEQKYPYFNIQDVITGLTDFTSAEDFPDPTCLKGKYWEVIKNEIRMDVQKMQNNQQRPGFR